MYMYFAVVVVCQYNIYFHIFFKKCAFEQVTWLYKASPIGTKFLLLIMKKSWFFVDLNVAL